MNLRKRKGQFFEMDAIVAISLLIVGLIYVRNLEMFQPTIDQNKDFSRESIRLFRTLKVANLNESVIIELEQSHLGIYTNRNFSIAKQIGIYFFMNNKTLAANLTNLILDSLIPLNYGYSVVIQSEGNESLITNRSWPGEYDNMAVTRTMITGLQQTKPLIGKLARLYLGNVRSNLREYVFFGGYIGQGDISFKVNLPADLKDVSEVNFEGYVGANMDVSVNSQPCGQISKTSGGKDKITQKSLTCPGDFAGGINDIDFEFVESAAYDQYIGGGFLEVVYTTSDTYGNPKGNKTYLPEIKGKINIFDSLFFDGSLIPESLKINLSFNKTDNFPTVFNFGNETLFETDIIGEHHVLLNESDFSTNILNEIDNKNVPFRFGTLEIIKGMSDVVWMTDRSNGANLGIVKEPGKIYTQKIVEQEGNNISLVGYGTDLACGSQLYGFINDASIINATIDAYAGNCGQTCMSCALWRTIENFNNRTLAPISNLPNSLEDDLISWWRMDDINSSGDPQDYKDTIKGSKRGSAIQINEGKFGKGFNFDGSGDYIYIGPAPELESGLTNFSISAWVKTRTIVGMQEIVRKLENIGTGQLLFRLNSDKIEFSIRTTTGYDTILTSPIVSPNRWHYITGVYDGANMKLYVDGLLNDTRAKTGSLDTDPDNMMIGCYDIADDGVCDSEYFNGVIDEVMIVNRSLSAEEIKEIHSIGRRAKFAVILGENETKYSWNKDAETSYLDVGGAANQARDYANEMCTEHNITLFAVSFGSLESTTTLKDLAQNNNDSGCSGKYFEATTELEMDEVLNNISILINSRFQSVDEIEGAFNNTLSGESYIEFGTSNPMPDAPPSSIRFMSKTERFSDIGTDPCNLDVDLRGFNNITEAKITSYSSDLWTSKVTWEGEDILNLLAFGKDFRVLGDPFIVHVPSDKLAQVDREYSISMDTARSIVETEDCSNYNRLIYTAYILKSHEIYSGIREKAEGCRWNISFADSTNKLIRVPNDYNGVKQCNYTQEAYASEEYDSFDAMDIVMYDLLGKLDVNNDGDLEVSISQSDLVIDSETIEEIPFLWGPAMIEVRVWN